MGADDFEASGQVLSEIPVHSNGNEKISHYWEEPIPEQYAVFNVLGLPTRVQGKGLRQSWAIVANISDHQTMTRLAALRLRLRNHE